MEIFSMLLDATLFVAVSIFMLIFWVALLVGVWVVLKIIRDIRSR